MTWLKVIDDPEATSDTWANTDCLTTVALKLNINKYDVVGTADATEYLLFKGDDYDTTLQWMKTYFK